MADDHITSIETLAKRLRPGDRLLGLDVGEKTIGLATSDATRTVATPLETIRRSKFSKDAVRLLRILDNEKVSALIIGLPVNMDGSEGPRAQSTRAFARNLTRYTNLPIIFWDERLSTAAAERTLLDADASRRRRKQVIDKMAASYILQGALDRLRHISG